MGSRLAVATVSATPRAPAVTGHWSSDTNWKPPEAIEAVERHAESLARSIRAALGRARRLSVDRLRAILRPITLPQVPTSPAEALMMFNEGSRMANCAECPRRLRRQGRFIRDAYLAVFEKIRRGDRPGRKTEIQGFAIGRLLLLAQPAELYHALYERLRRRIRNKQLILAGYSNDSVGYVPDRRSYRIDRLPLSGYASYAPYYVPIIKGEYRFRDDVGDVLFGELVRLSNGME